MANLLPRNVPLHGTKLSLSYKEDGIEFFTANNRILFNSTHMIIQFQSHIKMIITNESFGKSERIRYLYESHAELQIKHLELREFHN
jgi:hypothetical protein